MSEIENAITGVAGMVEAENIITDSITGAVKYYIADGVMYNAITGRAMYNVSVGSSGGSTAACDYYKCASVDTSAKTWTGYKATMTDGSYVFAGTETTGLTFGSGYTPKVGNIYNDICTVQIGKLYEKIAIPADGLILYVPFNGSIEAKYGKIDSASDTITFGEESGIKYANFNGHQFVQTTLDELPTECTMSINFKAGANDLDYNMIKRLFSISDYDALHISYEGPTEAPYIEAESEGMSTGSRVEQGTWHNFIYTKSSNKRRIYLDGVEFATSDYIPQSTQTCYIARRWQYSDESYMFVGSAFDAAVWNRVLTSEEIALVAQVVTALQ